MKNKGRFEILKRIDKYVIVYIEKGEKLNLSEIGLKEEFDSYEAAFEYIKNNRDSLDEMVSNYKEKIRKALEEKIAKEVKREELKRIKKELKEEKKLNRKEKSKGFWYSSKGIVASVVATAMVLTGGHFLATGLFKDSDKTKSKKGDSSQTSEYDLEASDLTVDGDVVAYAEENKEANEEVNKKADYTYNYDENAVIVNDEEYVELTTEDFENITALKIKELSDKGITLNSEDVIKYMMIANCDKLAQDNSDLIVEIMGEQTSDEIQQDANKFVGAVVMYNYNTWYSEESTENFIKVSDTIFDEEAREKVAEIEKRVDEIAKSTSDNVKFNQLVNDLLKDMLDPTNEISYLESGVGYALQIVLEPVRGLYGMDLYGNITLDEANADLIKYFVPYAGDEEEYKENNMLTGYIKDVNDILVDCPTNSKKLTK